MALARFDDRARASLTVASLGNINVRVFGAETPTTILARRGVVGLGSVAPLTTVCPWTPGSILIMHSDGLHSRWNWQEFSDLAQQPAQRIAERLLSRLAKPEDDATVLVARGIST
jgi:serine/threonine protein phosphatase PrpC